MKLTITNLPLVYLAPIHISLHHPQSPNKDNTSDHNSASEGQEQSLLLFWAPLKTSNFAGCSVSGLKWHIQCGVYLDTDTCGSKCHQVSPPPPRED